MTDIVKQLNIKAGVMEMGEKIAWGSDTALMREAATRIEELEAELVKPTMLSAAYKAERDELKDVIERLQRENNILKGSRKCLEREVQRYRIALEEIERHRGSTFWPQNETVESMAESAKQTLIDLGAWD